MTCRRPLEIVSWLNQLSNLPLPKTKCGMTGLKNTKSCIPWMKLDLIDVPWNVGFECSSTLSIKSIPRFGPETGSRSISPKFQPTEPESSPRRTTNNVFVGKMENNHSDWVKITTQWRRRLDPVGILSPVHLLWRRDLIIRSHCTSSHHSFESSSERFVRFQVIADGWWWEDLRSNEQVNRSEGHSRVWIYVLRIQSDALVLHPVGSTNIAWARPNSRIQKVVNEGTYWRPMRQWWWLN